MAIIGAILGDIAGQPFEFNRTKDIDWEHVKLFPDDAVFTDDTVLTVATKYALEKQIPFSIAYHTFGNSYQGVGYGWDFMNWLESTAMKPYGSYGNGSAMRVSPVIEFCENEQDVIMMATNTAVCTHNHPEGVKGAVVTAMCGWMAKKGASKAEIENYAKSMYPKENYGYSVELSLNEIRSNYIWNATCQGSVPVAIRCFLDSEDYESFLRNVIGLKGDADTLCAIGGCIAEEFYGKTGFDDDALLRKYLDDNLYEKLKSVS